MPDKMFVAFHTEPGEKECWSMIWSDGRECRRCPFDCYRAGWTKDMVMEDNLKLVERKLAEIAAERKGEDA